MLTESNINDVQAGQFLNTIVYMGAGSCNELDALLALQPLRMLLIEADPQLAATLQARTATLKQIQVHNIAVSGHPGPATFYRYNLPHAGSLHPASGLLELFPGLKTVEQLQMNSASPASLLQPLQIVAEQENLLIIDLPGEELPVLQALQQAGQLHLFSQLQLHCGRQPLYEGSKPASQILQWLRGQGFDVLAEDDTQDSDSPCWTLQRNALYLHNRELEQQLVQITNAREEQTRLANERLALIRQLTQERDVQTRQLTERQTQLDQVGKEKAEREKLAAERQNQIEQISKVRDEQTKLANERYLLIQQLTHERDEQAKWHLDNKKWAESLSAEKIQLEQQLVQITHAREEQTRLAAERQSQIEQISKVRDEQTKLANERQALNQQLTQERDEQAKWHLENKKWAESLSAEKSRLEQQLVQLTNERDEQAKWHLDNKKWAEGLSADKSQLEQQLAQLTNAREEQARLANERYLQIQQLTVERDQKSKMLAESQQKFSDFEQQRGELEHRQRLLDEEMIKAEAQLDLIKDILIREKAF